MSDFGEILVSIGDRLRGKVGVSSSGSTFVINSKGGVAQKPGFKSPYKPVVLYFTKVFAIGTIDFLAREFSHMPSANRPQILPIAVSETFSRMFPKPMDHVIP